VLTDTEQLEAELAAVRADAQAEVSSAAQLERPPAASDSEQTKPPRQHSQPPHRRRRPEQAASERARDAETRERDA